MNAPETKSPADRPAAQRTWPVRLPPASILVLIAATAIGLAGFLWSQRDTYVLVAQKGILFEQPPDPAEAGAVINEVDASVTWEAVTGGADGPEIVAKLDVPGTGQRISLTFRKNGDATLPATHLIEMVAGPQANFPDKTIADVDGLILKAAPNDRGLPLSGSTAEIGNGVFWFGLSSAPGDVPTNMGLLGQGAFFDLPLVYKSGQHATLTFEKGRTGKAVFEKVLTAWTR